MLGRFAMIERMRDTNIRPPEIHCKVITIGGGGTLTSKWIKPAMTNRTAAALTRNLSKDECQICRPTLPDNTMEMIKIVSSSIKIIMPMDPCEPDE